MKTNFWKFAALLGLGLAAVVACEKQPEPEKVAPVFPETVLEQNVEAGATVEVSFEANLDWELSIPAAEQAKYWLDDAGVPASKVTGKAGAQTVSVVFSEDEYYDQNVVCEVTLTMGGQDKVIARLTRLALNRTIEVYAAEKSDWSFKNTYSAEKATALELTTFEGDVTYTLPIKVVANYDWNLALPEWCEGTITGAETLSGKAGQVVEVLLSGKLAEGVKDGAAGAAKFFDAVDNSQVVELPLTLPAFADRVEWSEPASMSFDHTGVSAMPAIGYVLAMEGFVIRALEWEGEWHALEFADWVTATPGEATEGLLQNVAVTLGVSANEGKDRSADLFLFPASMADVKATDICDENSPACAFKEEYQKYHIGALVQKGVPMPFMVPVEDPAYLESEGVFFTELQPKGDDNIMQWDITSAESYHKITYTGQWSYEAATFSINKPFATCKFFEDTQYPEGFFTNEVTPDWIELWVNPAKTMGKFNMLYTPSTATHIAAVFYDENNAEVAAVLVEYNPAGGGSAAALELSVNQGEAQVSTLAPETELYQILSGNLGVSTVFEVQAAGDAVFQLNQPFAMASVFDMTLNPSTAVACECFDQNYVMVSPQADNAEVVIILKNDSWVNVAAIHYTYTKPAGGGSTLPDFVPTETLALMTDYGDRVALAVMESSHPAAAMLYEKYNTQNIWTLDCNNQGPIVTFTQPIGSLEVLDEEFNSSTVPFCQVMGTMVMIQAPTVKDITRIMLLKAATGNVMGVIYYTFTF